MIRGLYAKKKKSDKKNKIKQNFTKETKHANTKQKCRLNKTKTLQITDNQQNAKQTSHDDSTGFFNQQTLYKTRVHKYYLSQHAKRNPNIKR